MTTTAESNIRQRNAGSANITTNKAKKHINSKDEKPASAKNKFASVSAEIKAATSSHTHRALTRSVIILAVMVIVYFYAKNKSSRERNFALVRESLPLRMQKFQCSENYQKEVQQFPSCAPKKCGRFVADKLVEPKEAEVLLDLARRVITRTGSSGGASILDIHTGALTYGTEFIKVFNIPKLMAEFREEHLSVYNLVKGKIKLAIAEQFGIAADSLYLTYPTFFSRLTNVTAKTMNDEYWHEHVDKETYEAFHYTSLLYLGTYNKDFKGGRFIFIDGAAENRTVSAIEPKLARVSAFTSGAENRHHVEKVTEGERYAITISFTCNKNLRIADPKIQPQQ